MAVGVNIHEERRYVLKCDANLPKEEQTVFKLGYYSSVVSAYIKDKSIEFYNGAPTDESKKSERKKYSRKSAEESQAVEMRAQSLLGTQVMLTVKYGLRGLANFKIPEGGKLVPLEFTTHEEKIQGELVQAVDSEVLNALDPYLEELADAINEINTLPEAAEKN